MINLKSSQKNFKLIILRPVHIYNTAMVYYLKYHLTYPSNNRFTISKTHSIFLFQISALFVSFLLPDLLTIQ